MFLMRWKDTVITVEVGEDLECDLRLRVLETVVRSPKSPPLDKKPRREETVRAVLLERAMFEEECIAADARTAEKTARAATQLPKMGKNNAKHLLE